MAYKFFTYIQANKIFTKQIKPFLLFILPMSENEEPNTETIYDWHFVSPCCVQNCIGGPNNMFAQLLV